MDSPQIRIETLNKHEPYDFLWRYYRDQCPNVYAQVAAQAAVYRDHPDPHVAHRAFRLCRMALECRDAAREGIGYGHPICPIVGAGDYDGRPVGERG